MPKPMEMTFGSLLLPMESGPDGSDLAFEGNEDMPVPTQQVGSLYNTWKDEIEIIDVDDTNGIMGEYRKPKKYKPKRPRRRHVRLYSKL